MQKPELYHDEVDNPFRPGEKEPVVKNARESNAKTLRLGPAQSEAYYRIWNLYYQAGYGRQQAVDPSNEPVDCQNVRDWFPERAANANRELNWYRKTIGDEWIYIELTCLHGYGYKEVAGMEWGREPSKDEIQETRYRIRSTYNALTVEMGLSKRPTFINRLKSHLEQKVNDGNPSI